MKRTLKHVTRRKLFENLAATALSKDAFELSKKKKEKHYVKSRPETVNFGVESHWLNIE